MAVRQPDPDYRFKIVVIGAAGSGKTAMVDQLLTGEFQSATRTTVGVDYRSFRLDVKQNVIQLELWDTAGQETYRAVAKTYFRSALGCVLVFDTTSQTSFDELQFWLGQFRQLANPNALVLLAGNKIDLVDERQVSPEAAEQFAKDHLLEYFETSAATAQNIKETFEKVGRGIFELVQGGKLQVARVGEKPKASAVGNDDTENAIDITSEIARHGAGCLC
jgi:small GTP-binding protein